MIQRFYNGLNTLFSFQQLFKNSKKKFESLQLLNLVEITIITEIKNFILRIISISIMTKTISDSQTFLDFNSLFCLVTRTWWILIVMFWGNLLYPTSVQYQPRLQSYHLRLNQRLEDFSRTRLLERFAPAFYFDL